MLAAVWGDNEGCLKNAKGMLGKDLLTSKSRGVHAEPLETVKPFFF